MKCSDGWQETFDGCIIAAHAPDTLQMLGSEATLDERRILGAFQYAYRYMGFPASQMTAFVGRHL